ncbi:MAG: nicotinate-nicotinamide nucleotide adenylyltransferase [Candidatus Dadabacteria bacterium]
MKIGLLGGTFNPIHLGHLRGAEEIREILALNRIYFIPSSMPPHKDSSDVASAADRLKMVEFAIRENPFFDVCDIEVKRGGPSYTVHTLEYFSSKFSEFEIHFILGAELFSQIHTWKDYKRLFDLANFAVITRPGFPHSNSIPLALRDDFRYYKNEESVIFYIHKGSNKTLALVEIEGIQVSSTRIRELINRNSSIKYLVPKEVEAYILKNKIYTKEAI